MLTKDAEHTRNRIRAVLAELDSAASLMARAKASNDPDAVQRYKEEVYRAYQTAMGLILDTPMTDRQEHEVWDRVSPIRRWLEAARLLKQ